MTAASYAGVLDMLHRELQPRTYLEIGVRHGDSAWFALDGTKVIGVDPYPNILRPLPEGMVLVEMTSDDFFQSGRADELLGGAPVDFAFIDGMHLFEYALRDFINVERRSSPGSLIVLDDCLPPSAEAATREFHRGVWTGDVWKVLLYLRDKRPDLDVCAFDVSTGLGVVQGLDPARPVPDLTAAIDKYQGLDYTAFVDDLLPSLDVVRGSLEDMRARLPAESWQQRSDLASVIRSRDERSVPFATRLRRAKRGFVQSPPGRAAVAMRRRMRGQATSGS